MANDDNHRVSKDSIESTCKIRTTLNLGCRQCVCRKACIKFKFNHNGLSPYEIQAQREREEKENEGC